MAASSATKWLLHEKLWLLAPLYSECLDEHLVPSSCSKNVVKYLKKGNSEKKDLFWLSFRNFHLVSGFCVFGHYMMDGICGRDKLFTSWRTGSRADRNTGRVGHIWSDVLHCSRRNHLLSSLSAVKEEPIHQVKAHGLWISLIDTPKGVLYLLYLGGSQSTLADCQDNHHNI